MKSVLNLEDSGVDTHYPMQIEEHRPGGDYRLAAGRGSHWGLDRRGVHTGMTSTRASRMAAG
jgi:hypothetical protein